MLTLIGMLMILPVLSALLITGSLAFQQLGWISSSRRRGHTDKQPQTWLRYSSRQPKEAQTTIEECFDAWNRRDLDAATSFFSDDCLYEDTQFSGGPVGKADLRRRFQLGIDVLPKDGRVVADEIAYDPTSGKMGAKWHLEAFGGRTLPNTRGCSFYTTDTTTGLIKTGFRTMESPLKPDDAVLNFLAVPMKFAEGMMPSPSPATPVPDDYDSIIHKAWDGWNRRDMDLATSCFTDDVYYEDTLYLRAMSGKEELRRHLTRVSNQVPAICKIMVDDIAVSPGNGNIGVLWHLEVENSDLLEGWSRGCSLYTRDPETGLVKTGFDCTESPTKIDERGLNLLLSPLRFLRS